MPVLLHIGLFKTGNQSIQAYLRDREHELAKVGARFPRGYLRLNCHLEPHMALMRLDRTSSARMKGHEWRDPEWRRDLLAQVADDLDSHRDELTILSGEHNSLLRFFDELAPLRDLVGDARVVVYLRNRADWVASLRDELEKYEGLGVSTNPDAFNYLEPDSWLLDYDARINAWRQHFRNVTVLDYDDCVARDRSVLPSFCRLVGIPPPTEDCWLNARGTLDEGRVPGVRWSGGRFGDS